MARSGLAWQSSVSEQVPAERCPRRSAERQSATTSRAVSVLRFGGIVVQPPARVGSRRMRALHSLFVVLFLWRRVAEPQRLPA